MVLQRLIVHGGVRKHMAVIVSCTVIDRPLMENVTKQLISMSSWEGNVGGSKTIRAKCFCRAE